MGADERAPSAEETAREQAFVAGQRQVYRKMLWECVRGLGEDDPLRHAARLVGNLEEIRAACREICARHGNNDWPDNLDLSDVIRKYIAPLLDREPAE